jgi:DNA-binding GntR family transcriptional regulator
MIIEPGSLEHATLRVLSEQAARPEQLREALLARGLDVDIEQVKDACARLSEWELIESRSPDDEE